jgi:hypothetical protein
MDDIPIFATELEHKNFTEPHGNYKGGGVIAPETWAWNEPLTIATDTISIREIIVTKNTKGIVMRHSTSQSSYLQKNAAGD